MDDIVNRFLKEEEAVIRVNEGEINLSNLEKEIPIGVRIILVGKKRKRIMDLGILSFIYKYCKNGKDFSRDYLDLSLSLEDIFKKYKVYTELEFLALCESEEKNNLHKDLIYVLNKLKSYLISKNKR
ncbi:MULTISPECIES: hypothetical protein [Sulfurisphaera]|uniref:Uncharacterized protein n=2 Tax=Sulfurisphaera TaxID=69655 RepID=Q970W4_SULTO|nr:MULTISPECIES: hypothetical protein [Sulfurisphaera]MBB5252340.1 hypothetical protein [Sulfurisphaera ohwakuensis]BAB66559.1 hypothetical protein STK_14880 [Sulfurisphaera tokodaii str. 7]